MSATAKFYDSNGHCLVVKLQQGREAKKTKAAVSQAAAKQGYFSRDRNPTGYNKFQELRLLGKGSVESI